MRHKGLIGLFVLLMAFFVICGATWNADKPAVGNEISADIPDIEENFQELHDVVTAITNGTLGTTTAANFLVDAATTPLIWLKDSRARFECKDADEIYIHAGAYHHVGTVSQVVYWSSKLTSDIGSPGGSDWFYLYIDDSAVVTLGTNLLTTTELIWSATEPAWSETKHGWYNSDDRCIFATATDGSSNIIEFYHDGGDVVYFADDITDQSATDIDDTFTDAELTIPKFCTKAQVVFFVNSVGNTASITTTWRTNGQTASTGHVAAWTDGDAGPYASANTLDVLTDDSQKIEIKNSAAGANTIAIYTSGWYFPTGI